MINVSPVRLRRSCLVLLAVLPPATGLCDDPPPQKNVWTGKGQIGFVSSQGNTETRSANAAIDMTYTTDHWAHTIHADGLYARSTGFTSGERWTGNLQSNYTFAPSLFTYGALRYERDMFSGFNYQASASVGFGWKILDSKTSQLSIQVGPGYREEQPQTLVTDELGRVIGRIAGGSGGSPILSAALNASQNLTATSSISDKLLVESGAGNTLYTNDLELSLKASTHLAVSLGYTIQDNTNPPPGQKNLDSTETVNLVYSF